MAEIKIKDISIDGNDLFNDSEGFMDDLNEELLDEVNGGMLAESLVAPIVPLCTIPISPRPFPTEPISFPGTIVIL